MLKAQTQFRGQTLIGASFFAIGLLVAWQVGAKIVANDVRSIIFAAMGFAMCVVAVAIVRNWRTGFYFFLFWLMFEDLARKYMGNGLAFFFGKDILLGLTYLSFFVSVRRRRENTLRPPFLFFLSLFFWLGVLQMFNQNSPNIWYGLLGIKIYFLYVPLMFVGYALIRDDESLRRFLVVNALLAVVIAAAGILQGVLGNSFLNPSNLAPELQTLGDLQKTNLSGVVFNLPDSVFVSSGRFASYLAVAFILSMGAAGYLLLYTKRSRKLMFFTIGILGVAALLSGSRGTFVSLILTASLLSAGFLWGAPWRWKQGYRMLKAVRRSAIVAAAGLIVLFVLFPRQAGSRLQFYAETLLPNGGNYELGTRTWDYPVDNFLAVFSKPNWIVGNGIGTSALGTQYVAKLTGQPPPEIGVEEGYGTMIIEMGVLAPILWILWTAALVYYSWKVVRGLRETRFFPIGLAIVWYAVLLLFIWTYGSLSGYENYICNAYLWLLVGILFRLPNLARTGPAPAIVSPAMTPMMRTRPGFQF